MIRFVDGFDFCSVVGSEYKYIVPPSFKQVFMRDGRAGPPSRCIEIANTAFGETDWTCNIPGAALSTAGFHMNLKIGPNRFMFCDWYVFGSVLAIRLLANGHLQFLHVPSGTILDTTAAPLVLDQWYTAECKVVFGTSGSAEMRLDQATVLSVPHFNFGAVANISSVTHRWQVFGPPSLFVDDYVVWDGQPGNISDFIGPLRVTSLLPIDDAFLSWVPSSGAVAYAMVNDNLGRAGGSPDGSGTYITPATRAQLFDMQPPPCFGRNLAVVENIAMIPNGADRSVDGVVQLGAHLYTLGSPTTTGNVYRTYQAISEMSPDTGDYWTDVEIANGWWGVRAPATDPTRVTAFYLEKVTSLSNLPYNCGGGNYAY